MSREELQQRMAAFCDTVRSSPMWDAQQEMLLPGEIEYRTEQQRRASGIPLPADLYDELAGLAKSMGVPMEGPSPAP
jgi:LDH2 family malate/lactate/ureidoglycolate dehydrogenase